MHGLSDAIANNQNKLAKLQLHHSILICAIIYVVVTATGLTIDGFNSDDWRHLSGTPDNWAEHEGRWVMDAIYRYLFQERFHLPIQIALAFACFAWISYLLALYAVDKRGLPAAIVLIFTIGVNHIYMSDALTFNSHVFAYPFALVLSLGAFHYLYKNRGDLRGRQLFVSGLIAAQLIALGIGIYQTYAVFGLVIPALMVLRIDKYNQPGMFRLLIVCAIVFLAALLLYKLEWQLYLAIQDRTIEDARFVAPTLEGILHKISYFPYFSKTAHSGGLMSVPGGVRIFYAGFFLVVLLSVFVAALAVAANQEMQSLRERLFESGRIIAGAIALLLILPFLFWFLYDSLYAPARTVGFIGFINTVVLLANLFIFLKVVKNRPVQKTIVNIVFAGLVGVAAVSLLLSSTVWDNRARVAAGDLTTARAIFSRVVNLEGYTGGPIRLVGGIRNSSLSWGAELGWTVFHEGNPKHGIFKETFNLPWRAESVSSSPRPCRAFPSYDSAFIYEGIAYVCLEDKTTEQPMDPKALR